MLKLVILLTTVGCALGAAVPEGMLPQLDGRIVGGFPVNITNIPWQVSIQRSGYHSCGGSVYNEWIIVTAAHCLPRSSSVLKVRAGSSLRNSGGVLVDVADFKRHKNYDSFDMENDIGIIRLKSPLTFSSTIKPIALATTAPANGAAASVSGWGVTSFGSPDLPAQLRYIDTEIVSRSQCASAFYYNENKITDSMICAYTVGKDSCQGDSGGPLVSDGVLVGVVSWGQGCAAPNYPGVYADVATLRDWVVSNAKSV